jgi:hypothetical protein
MSQQSNLLSSGEISQYSNLLSNDKSQLFIKDGYVCYLKKNINEPIEHFIERGNFVTSQKPQNVDEYNEYVNYSRIMINIKYNKTTYNNEVMQKYNNMINKSYI